MSSRLDLLYQMLVESPNDPFLKYAIALERHKAGEVMRAIELLEELINSNENYLGAYYQLGKYYEEIADLGRAILTYKKGLKLAKLQNEVKTYRELGEALFMIEDGE